MLSRICDPGGNPCTTDADCGTGKCVINFEEPPPSIIPATLTFIIDDHAPNLDEETKDLLAVCPAATVLLEVKRRLLAKTYFCIPLDTDLEVGFLRTESGLQDSITDASILNRLLFRGGGEKDVFDPMVEGLHDIFGVTSGKPIVVGTPQKIKPRDYTNHEGDEVASVLRMKIQIRFVKDD
jgi:hypothetical protein